MFFTFLSVCTTAELLQIPLTLDTTKTITIPQGFTDISETILISPSDDPDFQKYLDKIKGYTIESVTFSTSNIQTTQQQLNAALGVVVVNFPDLGFKTNTEAIILSEGSDYPLNISGEQLASLANYIQKNGIMKMELRALSVNFNGSFNLKIKINLKIKV